MRVRVPASIANLGAGFDVFAMAVDLWLEVEAEPAARPDWRFEGEGAQYLNEHPNPLSGLAMRGRVHNAIPVGVGLGSSAAARLAAAALQGNPLAFRLVASQEGHPDNAAAAAFGGIRMVIGESADALPVPNLQLALLVADSPLPTEAARAALREAPIDRADAVFNAARTAWFVKALYTAQWNLLHEALQDRLHQPQRMHLYPWVRAAMDAARSHQAYGSAVCGAGPSVFAFCAPGEAAGVAAAMVEAAGRGRPLVAEIAEFGMTFSG